MNVVQIIEAVAAVVVAVLAWLEYRRRTGTKSPGTASGWPWPIFTMTILASLTWVGVGVGAYLFPTPLTQQKCPEPQKCPEAEKNSENYIKAIGLVPAPECPTNVKQAEIIVDGNRVAQYANKYQLAGIVFHPIEGTDVNEIKPLQKSRLFAIRNEEERLLIWPDDSFRKEMKDNCTTDYILLLVPVGVTLEQFDTLNQAKSFGVREVGHARSNP